MRKDSSDSITQEKRSEPRSTKLKDYRVEIKLVGEPIYQFRVTDVSTKGAGLLIKDDSRFLKLIEVGQFVDANFISPKGLNPTGMYKAEIRHITKMDKGKMQKPINRRVVQHDTWGDPVLPAHLFNKLGNGQCRHLRS